MGTRRIAAILLTAAMILGATPAAFAAREADKSVKSKRRTRRHSAEARSSRMIDLGLKRLRAKNFSAAIVAFDQASRIDPSSANAFFHLGNAYYERAFTESNAAKADKNFVGSAIDAYETALAIDPALGLIDDPFLLYHGLSQCFEAQGRLKEALGTIKKATRVSRKNPMPYLYGARIRFKMQDYDKSAANLYYSVRRARRANKYPALARLIKSNPLFSGLLTVPQNKLILDAYDAVESGTLTEKEARERIRGFSPYRDALTNLPTRSPRAIAAPVSRKDTKVLTLITQGHRAYNHQSYRQAIRSYRAAMTADSEKGTLDAMQMSLLLERIGSSYRQLGLVGEAIRVFKLAIEELPGNTAAHYRLALSYSVSGQLGKAMTSLNRALDTAHSLSQLRKTLLMARTDLEFSPLRDLARYKDILKSHSPKNQGT